ncbi:MFS transporter [Paenibacillus sp. GCM10012307]
MNVQREEIRIRQRRGIWANRDFLKFWTGQSLSMVGSQITLMALPLIAAITLNATPFQMGVLHAVEYAPFLLFGLLAGVWVDRWPKKILLVISDFGRAALLITIPLLAWFDSLNIFYVCLISFLTGILTTFYSIAYQSALPYMLKNNELIDGNAKMEFSRSVAGVSGPGFAGVMVQWMTGAFSIILNSISFLISGFLTSTITVNEPEQRKDRQSRLSVWEDMGKGLSLVFTSRYLRSIAACSATFNFFYNMIQAVLILYATRVLEFSPVTIGLVMTLGSIGAVLSAILSNRLVGKFGFGPVITGSAFCQGIGFLFLIGATGSKGVAFGMMFASMFIVSFATTVYNIAQLSFRQSITEPEMLGRMNATMRFVVWGVIPIGALTGGALGTWIGLYMTIIVAIIGGILSFLWVFWSPVRSVTAGKVHME